MGLWGMDTGCPAAAWDKLGNIWGHPPSHEALSRLRMWVVSRDLSASLQGGQKHLHAQTCPRREDPAQLVLVLRGCGFTHPVKV